MGGGEELGEGRELGRDFFVVLYTRAGEGWNVLWTPLICSSVVFLSNFKKSVVVPAGGALPSQSPPCVAIFLFFIALAWQSAHREKGGKVGGIVGDGGVAEEKGGENMWLVQQLVKTVIILCKGSRRRQWLGCGGGGRRGVPLTDVQHMANPDWLICAILLSGSLKMDAAGSTFLFFYLQMATTALCSCVTGQLEKWMKRGEGSILPSLRLVAAVDVRRITET